MIHWRVRVLSCEPNSQLNVCTTSVTEDEVGAVTSLSPQHFITDRSKAVVPMWYSVACVWCQSFGNVSPYVCYYTFLFDLGCWVTTFWEIAAHSVGHFFSLYFVYFVMFVISHFCFERGICLLISPVLVHCFLITFTSFKNQWVCGFWLSFLNETVKINC